MQEKKNTNKSIFVSSTFRDMQAERDTLRDFVLPQVNEFAAKYGRAVEIIDLRWGVDTAAVTEAEQNDKVLRTCLDEIERSRPFFLGLIGDRYGWTPPTDAMEAALQSANFPLEDTNMSVTALEIEYGVLRSEIPPTCLFYFRESPNYAAMPKKLRRVYQDETKSLAKLAKIKEEIHAHFEKDIKSYTANVHKNELTVSKDWAEMVTADIITKLREDWGEPSETLPDWKEQEHDLQESFRESRTAHFAGRTAAIADLTAFCLGSEATPQILMLQGEAGSGKSGLLCKVMEAIEDQSLILPFSCGISPRSSLAENMLRYFISIICKKLSLEDDSDEITKFQELKDRFMELLFAACQKMRVAAVVDALDQLAGSNEARRMLWINGKLPENFRLLCSIIDGPEIEAAKQLGAEIRPMPAISEEDETAIIHGIASRHHKQIAGKVVEHILKKEAPGGTQAAQNPLYLSLITQNLVMMDRYELGTVQNCMDKDRMSQPEALAKFMQERIDETPGDPESAYLAILNRLENLIGKVFVRGVCGMIAVSRSGLRESDLESAFKELKMDFNPADFSWLRQMLRGHINQGDMQQWDFAHQSLRRALRKDRPEELKKLNEGIFRCFIEVIAEDDFAVREIIHHSCIAGRSDLTAQIISKYGKTQETKFAQGLADAYSEHENGAAFLLAIPRYLVQRQQDMKKSFWSIKIILKAVKIRYSLRKASSTKLLQFELETLHGDTNYSRGGSDYLRVAETIKVCLKYLPENTRPFRIELMLATLSMLKVQEYDRTKRLTSLYEIDLANLYTEIGETEKAEIYFRKSSGALEQQYEQKEENTTLRALVESYINMGLHLEQVKMRTEEASEHYKKAINAAESLLQKNKSTSTFFLLYGSYTAMGRYLKKQGKFDEAGIYFHKALEAGKNYSNLGGQMSSVLATAYSYMGVYLSETGQVEEAGIYIEKGHELFQQIYEQNMDSHSLDDLAVSYGDMGDHLIRLGKKEEAELFYKKELNARETFYDQRQTIEALSRLSRSNRRMGNHLAEWGRKEDAEVYYKKAIELDQVSANKGNAQAQYNLGYNYDIGNGVPKDHEKANYWYTKAAEQGFAQAQCNLGYNYEKGNGVPKDLEKANYWYTKAAEQGNSEAQTYLGYNYDIGNGVPKDLEKANYWYEKAAEQGNARAQYNIGVNYTKGEGVPADSEKANYWFTKAAKQGYTRAQFKLGYNYANGKGVPVDFEKANHWYEKAAEQGYLKAQVNLGLNYANGCGMPVDFEKANHWFTNAAEKGDAFAMSCLGISYANGNGVPIDLEKAHSWFTKAAEQDHVKSQLRIGLNYAEGKGVSKDLEKAKYWLTKAAEQGNETAQYNLGFNYANGKGVPLDLDKANHWFSKAAEQGYAEAQFQLGLIYAEGKGVPADFEKSNYWFAKAAKQGHVTAQYNLGISYANGNGVSIDLEKAHYWYAKAAEQGYAAAQCNLGLNYTNGKGVPLDLDKMNYWYKKAAEQGYAIAQYYLGYNYDTGHGVSVNYEKANYWYAKAAEQGHPTAQFNLGYNYETGSGVSANIKKANYWYEKAAEQGHVTAQFNLGYNYAKAAEQGHVDAQLSLGINYANGNGVPVDFEKANYWYAKAAEQGYAAAQCNLGYNYANGRGVSVDFEKANYWYAKAAEQGYVIAQYNLGYNYAKGYGVSIDLEKAKHWFTKAAEQGNETAKKELAKLNSEQTQIEV